MWANQIIYAKSRHPDNIPPALFILVGIRQVWSRQVSNPRLQVNAPMLYQLSYRGTTYKPISKSIEPALQQRRSKQPYPIRI